MLTYMPSALVYRRAVGYSGSDTVYVTPEEVAYICGNALVLHSSSGAQVGMRFVTC